jgi:hypothetical protein
MSSAVWGIFLPQPHRTSGQRVITATHGWEETPATRGGNTTFRDGGERATLGVVPNQPGQTGVSGSLRDLRDDGIDQTLQNLLRALTLNLELRARYRVFEFEASQDGHPDIARLFRELRVAESEQIADLMSGLHGRLGEIDRTQLGGDAG